MPVHSHRYQLAPSNGSQSRSLRRPLPFGWALIFVCALATLALATPVDPLRYRSGIRNGLEHYRLNGKQLKAVLESLRDKTGFLEMRFDESGFLDLGDRSCIAGGSAAARALLIAAVDGDRSFYLENHNHSEKVAFARLGTATLYQSRLTGAHIESQPLEIDFFDFAQLRGCKEVLAAFDLGFAVLHELGHGALHLHDAQGLSDGLGECESYINRIRRELGLPERQQYIAQIHQSTSSPSGATIRRAELIFARALEKQGRVKMEDFYLSWEAKDVGEIVIPSRPASLRKDHASALAMDQ